MRNWAELIDDQLTFSNSRTLANAIADIVDFNAILEEEVEKEIDKKFEEKKEELREEHAEEVERNIRSEVKEEMDKLKEQNEMLKDKIKYIAKKLDILRTISLRS